MLPGDWVARDWMGRVVQCGMRPGGPGNDTFIAGVVHGTSIPGRTGMACGQRDQVCDLWAWAIPPPLKVYSECPEGRRSDGLLLPAPHEGWGLLVGQSWMFGMARGCVWTETLFQRRDGAAYDWLG